MNVYFLLAGILATILGVLHSVIGERLVFSRLIAAANRDDLAGIGLSPRRIRAMRSTWHLLSIFGWGFAALLLILSSQAPPVEQVVLIRYLLITLFGLSSVFWLVGTKGKHPAWIVLLIITCCVGLA